MERRSPAQIRAAFERLSPREQAEARYRNRRDSVSSSWDRQAWRDNEERAHAAYRAELAEIEAAEAESTAR